MEHEHLCERPNKSISIDSIHAIFMSTEDNISTWLLSISKLLHSSYLLCFSFYFEDSFRTQSNIFDGAFLQK